MFTIFDCLNGQLQESKNHKHIIVFFLLIAVALYVKKGLDLCYIPPNHPKHFPKILPMAMSAS